ncbi:unnamed protein product (macronuclear) [Paramecium tetraurelia]|uniref:Uncharacterized protein n=1 Tax=Paramecium tetraurelia TaxID=5888 RepID=A0D7I8_PARTE|nr:uncharacterized protein GSPATT00002047001 [Paramecium tetraurelia]CAK79005.1 unnamed protein product [Paramecium tetraurelia]|eukprot:XP_001446402.1 hypothetical protein (macronuclear) [Paramecium tetraurelia strain d4-2]
MGCHIQTGRQVQLNDHNPSFEQQLLEIDKMEFFKNRSGFKIVLQPILFTFSQEKGETHSQDEND